jgi:bacillithiol biosynthesis cysteine-adding enzyme BshC
VKRLAADYAFNFPSVASFYAGDPASAAAWSEAIVRTQKMARPRTEMAAILAAQQLARQAPPRALEAARRLADPRAVAIVTGQQAGLFGGPLFTLLKALTALKLADLVSQTHGVPVVPIFWIDAEDHDWDEVRGCTVFDNELEPHTVALPPHPADDPTPVANIRLDESAITAIDELERYLPDTEFRAATIEKLRRAYAPGTGMADAFGRWLEQILGERGLVVYNAADAAAKPFVKDLFSRELTSATTARLAGSAGADLTARGYHSQVQLPGDALALFHLDGARRPIRRQNGEFLIGDQPLGADRLVERAANEPSRFSPNVLLRPIVQDSLFPTICYVAGPSELAYLGQLRDVYEHFAVPMPLMYPRASATLVDAGVFRFLTRYGVPFETLQAQDDAALNELLKSQIPEEIEASLTGAARAVEAAMARVVAAMPLLDPTLEGAARSTEGRMKHDLESLQGKTIQAAKRKNETLRRQFLRARTLVFPHGHPQERTIGFVSFLNQYGPALVERLEDELPLGLGHHWVIAI